MLLKTLKLDFLGTFETRCLFLVMFFYGHIFVGILFLLGARVAQQIPSDITDNAALQSAISVVSFNA